MKRKTILLTSIFIFLLLHISLSISAEVGIGGSSSYGIGAKQVSDTTTNYYNNTNTTINNYLTNSSYVPYTNTSWKNLTEDNMADSLHRHSELSASDGSPNPALRVDASGRVNIGGTYFGTTTDNLLTLESGGNPTLLIDGTGEVANYPTLQFAGDYGRILFNTAGDMYWLAGDEFNTMDIVSTGGSINFTTDTYTFTGQVGSNLRFKDNYGTVYGTGDDASIKYDGTNLNIKANDVGTGHINLNSQTWVNGLSIYPAITDFSVGKNGAIAYGGWSVSSDTAAHMPTLFFARSRGTHASPTAITAAGQGLGILGFYGQGGTNVGEVYEASSIRGYPDGAFTTTSAPGNLRFYTTPTSTIVGVERVRITSAGDVVIGATTASARLHSVSTAEQLRLGYDASNYKSETISSTGTCTTALTGTSPINNFSQAVKFSGGTQSSDGSAGISVTIVTAQLTALGSQGSMTFKNGLLTAQTPAT